MCEMPKHIDTRTSYEKLADILELMSILGKRSDTREGTLWIMERPIREKIKELMHNSIWFDEEDETYYV